MNSNQANESPSEGRLLVSAPRWQQTMRVAVSITAAAVLAISLAPKSIADSTEDLKSRIDSTRAAGGCSPLQLDPLLNDVASRANRETDANIRHTARFEPFEDPMPILRELGYNASKAKLLVGYGDVDAKAIYGLVLQGFEAIPDCSYKKYGVNAFANDSRGYALTAAVLAT